MADETFLLKAVEVEKKSLRTSLTSWENKAMWQMLESTRPLSLLTNIILLICDAIEILYKPYSAFIQLSILKYTTNTV